VQEGGGKEKGGRKGGEEKGGAIAKSQAKRGERGEKKIGDRETERFLPRGGGEKSGDAE